MKLYSENGNYKLYNGNMLDMLDIIDPCSIDAIITDPPYELNFMNKGWDNSGIAFQKETWEKCFQVLKSGGYLLAFGGSRTSHRIACAIEDAGFEIRDTIMWLYGSGFPKSMNIGLAIDKKMGIESEVIGIGTSGKEETHTRSLNLVKGGFGGKFEIKKAQNEWNGWGTALKPSYEPIIVARKPCEGSCVDNVLKYGVGGINIDECRIDTNGELIDNHKVSGTPFMRNADEYNQVDRSKSDSGRFPANTILTYDETDFDEVCGGMPNTKGSGETRKNTSGTAARYFYCAKASKRDRDEGLENFEPQKGIRSNAPRENEEIKTKPRKNIHPTVKPTSLMQYLVRLVAPKNGIILDPFNGSGSTGKAVMYENKDRNANYKYIGIELTEEYLPITQARIEYAQKEI